MPSGKYDKSEEHKQKISKTLLGRHVSPTTEFKKGIYYFSEYGFSEDSKKKMSETRKRLFKEGKLISPMKGKHHTSEAREKLSKSHKGIFQGEKSPNWLGGKSFEPYTPDFNKQFKKLIMGRDSCCMLCKTNIEDLKLLKRRIHIHHIDYNKLNNLPQNCCALCISCHLKTNFDRTIWTKHFHTLLAEKYGYNYDENQNIVINLDNQINQGGKK